MNKNTKYIEQSAFPSIFFSILASLIIFGSTVQMCLAQSNRLLNLIDAPDIQTFLLKVIEVLLVFALPIIILFIMYAGYLFVVAQGNPSKIEEARSALLWAVIGGVIILGANVIYGVIKGTISAF